MPKKLIEIISEATNNNDDLKWTLSNVGNLIKNDFEVEKVENTGFGEIKMTVLPKSRVVYTVTVEKTDDAYEVSIWSHLQFDSGKITAGKKLNKGRMKVDKIGNDAKEKKDLKRLIANALTSLT
jgi:hypothetical protein